MPLSSISSPSATNPNEASGIQSKTSSVSAMIVGGLFVFMIGFSHISAVHNAAHDTRHSSAFPCH